MNLTAGQVANFPGCDIAIQNEREDYLFRGPITEARIVNGDIVIQMEWLAKNNGGLHNPDGWTSVDDPKDYIVSLRVYSTQEEDGNIILYSAIVGDKAIIFPKDGDKLSPIFVDGLLES